MSAGAGADRIDRWLFFARLCKSRSLAQRLCEDGMVSVSGIAVQRPSQLVRPGMEIAVTFGRTVRRVRVTGIGMRRGPASEAALLYEDLGRAPAPDDWD